VCVPCMLIPSIWPTLGGFLARDTTHALHVYASTGLARTLYIHPYMTVVLVISLPKLPCIQRIYIHIFTVYPVYTVYTIYMVIPGYTWLYVLYIWLWLYVLHIYGYGDTYYIYMFTVIRITYIWLWLHVLHMYICLNVLHICRVGQNHIYI